MIGTQRNKQNEQLFYPGKTHNIQELEISFIKFGVYCEGREESGWQYKLLRSYQKKPIKIRQMPKSSINLRMFKNYLLWE